MGVYRGLKVKGKGTGKCDRSEVKTARQGRKSCSRTKAEPLPRGEREALAKSFLGSAESE